MAFAQINDVLNEEKRSKISLEVLKCFGLGSNREMFCDFTVAIDDYEFPCHRFVLNACSGFFEGMLRCDMRESREMRVSVQGISPDIFRLILDVLYGGYDVLTAENVILMWQAANQLQISLLVALCEDFVMENNTSSNFYETYKHAHAMCSARVIDFMFRFITENFFVVVSSDNFTQIQYEDLLQILKDRRVFECADFQIDAILKWCGTGKQQQQQDKGQDINRDTQSMRHQYVGSLLAAVNLGEASTKCLAGLMTNDLVLNNITAVTAVNRQVARNMMNPYSVPANIGQSTCPHCHLLFLPI